MNNRRQAEEWLALLPGLSWPDRLLLGGISLWRRIGRRFRRREFYEIVWVSGQIIIGGRG